MAGTGFRHRFSGTGFRRHRFSAPVFEEGSSLYLIRLGLMLLIATPVARVALSLTLFARARDWMYCVVTGIVLTVLLASLWIA